MRITNLRVGLVDNPSGNSESMDIAGLCPLGILAVRFDAVNPANTDEASSIALTLLVTHNGNTSAVRMVTIALGVIPANRSLPQDLQMMLPPLLAEDTLVVRVCPLPSSPFACLHSAPLKIQTGDPEVRLWVGQPDPSATATPPFWGLQEGFDNSVVPGEPLAFHWAVHNFCSDMQNGVAKVGVVETDTEAIGSNASYTSDPQHLRLQGVSGPFAVAQWTPPASFYRVRSGNSASKRVRLEVTGSGMEGRTFHDVQPVIVTLEDSASCWTWSPSNLRAAPQPSDNPTRVAWKDAYNVVGSFVNPLRFAAVTGGSVTFVQYELDSNGVRQNEKRESVSLQPLTSGQELGGVQWAITQDWQWFSGPFSIIDRTALQKELWYFIEAQFEDEYGNTYAPDLDLSLVQERSVLVTVADSKIAWAIIAGTSKLVGVILIVLGVIASVVGTVLMAIGGGAAAIGALSIIPSAGTGAVVVIAGAVVGVVGAIDTAMGLALMAAGGLLITPIGTDAVLIANDPPLPDFGHGEAIVANIPNQIAGFGRDVAGALEGAIRDANPLTAGLQDVLNGLSSVLGLMGRAQAAAKAVSATEGRLYGAYIDNDVANWQIQADALRQTERLLAQAAQALPAAAEQAIAAIEAAPSFNEEWLQTVVTAWQTNGISDDVRRSCGQAGLLPETIAAFEEGLAAWTSPLESLPVLLRRIVRNFCAPNGVAALLSNQIELDLISPWV